MTTPPKIGSDNATEDYFLDLLVNKHIIDREIQDLIDIVEKSSIHWDYQVLIKKILFGDKNIYLENWWTLESNLKDIIKSINIRGTDIESYGIVLRTMIRVVEEVFDVDDCYIQDFLMSEEKEDIEHRLIILMKRVLDFIEIGLKEMLGHTTHLDKPIIDNHIRKEFSIIRDTLLQYSWLILESEWDHIRNLKLEVDTIVHKINQKKTNLRRISR